jgi:hypothetical protein
MQQAAKRGIDSRRFEEFLLKGFILGAEDVDGAPDPRKPGKFYCVSKDFLTWVTLIVLLKESHVVIITVYPSKKDEVRLCKIRKRALEQTSA